MEHAEDRKAKYQKNSLTLIGAVALGTGVMIGAGIFALTGQMAEMTGALFPLAFLSAAVIVSFSAYSYVKMSNAYPSAGGIGMYLYKAYGGTLPTAFHALLMYFSMVIAQSFLARTFGSYTMQIFDAGYHGIMVPALAVGVLIVAFLINLSSNRLIEGVASFIGFVKIGGIIVFGVAGIWVADTIVVEFTRTAPDSAVSGFLAATALGILAFKGFTTITNSGSELKDPHHNVGRAIMISIALCVVIYTLVGFAVASNLSLTDIIATQDYSLAAAAKPALGDYGLWFTVTLAMLATAGGIIASIFAVSRMLAMLTEMKLVPHSHFGMPGSIQKHTLVYTVVIGIVLTAFFDLSRIAALGVIFYLIMDIAVHWGILRYLRQDIHANVLILITAILLDLLVLAGFLWVKLVSDPLVVGVAITGMVIIATIETIFLRKQDLTDKV
ncbi:MAG: amino acid permease [Zetaproteobacteria bacterium CG12_big_fil_rev_8_21_14_0_65_54_13]|nr:MAG: amino acid permease [Zetaproteobacteria bacterium CG12_big_fil_rev_8_21_14_0_65_54_13]PIX53479.1 MAG: amino acid permease [Zetaproteobacteria bacterium CG_4_10_14_3_um_filter_54_28]PJA30914.1 MAG: amino acid permease [Zetaproteobacteria bacterium CG_4_9_14_3_um_filter_54_145]